MKCTDQVFPSWMVDTGFPADGRIHHRQQGRWNLNDPDATQPGCGRESSHVPDDPTTQGQHQCAALEFLTEGGIVNQRHGRGGLLVFPGFNHQQFGLEACLGQGLQADFAVGAGHIGIADHQDPTSRADARIEQLPAQILQAAVSDDHVVGRSLQGDGDPAVGLSARDSHG